MNAEFHSTAARSANALDHDQLTAARGLFLFRYRVPSPYLRADPHEPLPPDGAGFPPHVPGEISWSNQLADRPHMLSRNRVIVRSMIERDEKHSKII